jgi:hypothetical protein
VRLEGESDGGIVVDNVLAERVVSGRSTRALVEQVSGPAEAISGVLPP